MSQVPHAGDFSDEDAYNFDTDGFDRRVIRVSCPHCQREFAPLCSRLTVEIDGGWRWVGCDHREPYTTWRTRCGACRCEFTFTTYTPQ